ncbi:uncharacterized protein EKO05_0009593 [Ascochyta rabiei]|uniref:Uncharacterized protein n=1 Tax=Didymella rabiei TaxID=5454 RepID=A0A163CTU0_DIDRA|nr:uncharacterized protein EKO05_0009593 [Ascochyta rabiei]KZM22685.1 hypothetical protein ST47_g6281 [Ascochyta rabiei]UPX19325.1 hypothetical protein EKO05_0009593 [Ascochyta rabiei]
MGSNDSLQFEEPAHPHIPLHTSSATDSTGSADSNAARAGGASKSPPALERQSSVGKIASLAKTIVKSPQEEKEYRELDKTLDHAVKKGPKEVDVGLMEA